MCFICLIISKLLPINHDKFDVTDSNTYANFNMIYDYGINVTKTA
jgi:hypothetical protein